MAEIVLGIGTSHSPLLGLSPAEWVGRGNDDKHSLKLNLSDGRHLSYSELEAEVGARYAEQATLSNFEAQSKRCQQALNDLQAALSAAAPDVVVIIGDDQDELFPLTNLPAFAIYYGDELATRPLETMEHIPDWLNDSEVPESYAMDEVRHFAGSPEMGRFLIEHLVARHVDVAAISKVAPTGIEGFGHAFGFIIHRLFNGRKIPVIPVLLNTYFAPNRPVPERCYHIGKVLREAIESFPEPLRVAVVASGGLSHFVCDKILDRQVLTALETGDADTLCRIPQGALNDGSSEISNWIMLAGAMEGRTCELVDYVPVQRTPAGTGVGLGFMIWK
jgi:hypothetical protein